MLKINLIFVLVLWIFLVTANAVQVYEEVQEDGPVDISGNVNSTGPVVYPAMNITQGSSTKLTMMSMMNRTNNVITSNQSPQAIEQMNPMLMKMNSDSMNKMNQMSMSGDPMKMNMSPMLSNMMLNQTQLPNMFNKTQSIPPISPTDDDIVLRSNVNNQTMQMSPKVKENSLLKSRQSYLHHANPKPFISSPKDIATRMSDPGHTTFSGDSFQPMINKPFLTQTPQPQTQYVQTQTKNHYHHAAPQPQAEEQVHLNSARDLVYHKQPPQQHKDQPVSEYNTVHHYVEKEPNLKDSPPPIDYNSFQKYFFPNEGYLKEQQPKYNSIQEYIQNDPKAASDHRYIAWPESQDGDDHKQSTIWTTEQPEFQTHPYKFPHSTPTEYPPPKGFLSSALSMFTKSLKPSIPTHPYPFELHDHQSPKWNSDSHYHHFPSAPASPPTTLPQSIEPPTDHKSFEKYEIITTSPPEYHFQTKLPSTSGVYHETELVRPSYHHHNHPSPQLPWHKIIKVLSAIIPFGLLVSALTPNVVLINPNATSTKPIGNIYSYVTRQRSLEPEHVFNERIMKIVNGLDESNPKAACIKQTICEAIASNRTEDVTPDEYIAFQERICKDRKKRAGRC